MSLLRLSSIVSVKLKYTRPKTGSSLLLFKRRIPNDIKPLLPAGSKYAGKTHYVVSLQTADPRVAAPKVAQLVKETDEDWERLRNPTRAGHLQEARELLTQYGIDPANLEDTPEGALWAFEDLIEAQVPQSVLESEHITEGRQLDQYLSPVHAAAFQMRQGRLRVTLADCLDQYVKTRPDTEADARLVFNYLFAFLGERSGTPRASVEGRDMRSIRRSDSNAFVAWLLAGKHSRAGKPIRTSTVERYLRTLTAAFNLAIRENELGGDNVFSNVEIPKAGEDVEKRETFTVDQYRHLYRAIDNHTATKGPDQLRCILTLVAETGARLAEIVGMAGTDVRLSAAVPYLDLRKHPWRTLKNDSSVREVPLTPRAQEAVQAALRLAGDSPFLFPAYTNADQCKADSVSASLVKWVRNRDGLKGTKLGNHSLRHGMEDLLRAVGCPGSVRDQITGHKTPGMGANYGEGYPLEMLADWLNKATSTLRD
ncbi:tyrosine-type recombinase/integrase [Burkholderia diffusa]|uniref:Phage integrase domain/SAM domain-containing protein n=1 Tax=Burkholderia diffusa TaxID=488732 RepID=A0A6P2LTZ5_9BURK|nr:tyrosine-type recombinase/integrase [Burkholderia diffusa]KAB0657128.1 tyrosine-type recombinase/integrase [Burkholderia diffusa]MBM2655025.1 tyrosine-type recombinase/integrase [Burkholderia diffusa]VWB75602.1 phage integrase domain/SAM domain-containing protein [Burkholderia diffusa]